ncbi:uncharacterized protein LOC111080935 [Drosophila obscura]|uniref:uncharacterized protein LOC111080935 n=1 Tax=Drosophila obscura TaxID=7282 RepID=UPI001BB2C1A4|nr:uncharacterized protein LOC111080935 [Drosophila obscura]
MNRMPQQFSPRVGLEVLLDGQKSQLVRYRANADCPHEGNSKLETPEMLLNADSSQLSLDEGLEVAPFVGGSEEGPEIASHVDHLTYGHGNSSEIPPSSDDSSLVCYEGGETCTDENSSQLGADESSKICPYEASSQALKIGPLEAKDDEDDYQSGVQIVEILQTPRGVPKVTRDMAEINMRKKRWEDKLNAYKGVLARNHELCAIYEQTRLEIAAGLAEITMELGEIDLDMEDIPGDQADRPEDVSSDGNEMAVVKADEKPNSSHGSCAVC